MGLKIPISICCHTLEKMRNKRVRREGQRRRGICLDLKRGGKEQILRGEGGTIVVCEREGGDHEKKREI